MKWGNISAKRLNIERAVLFAVSISLKTKAIRRQYSVSGTGKYLSSSAKASESC